MASSDSNPVRILVVDDERTIADTLTAILNLAGFQTRTEYSGDAAVEAAREFRPDVLLADHYMPPGITGMEAAMRIKRMLPGCRVFMLSGQALGGDMEPYQKQGYNFILLSKPMHPTELVSALKDESSFEAATQKLKVLNVDDVEAHRYSISRLLSRAGFEVTEAATGADAIRHAIDEKPQLVLLDINLPDKSGYDVCEQLKRNPETAQITVVHITASDKSEEAAARSATVGADEYLTHPILPSRLIHRLRSLLQLRYLEASTKDNPDSSS